MKLLRAYQQVASDRAMRENLLIADACGTGKTITSIDVVKRVRATVTKPVLIVVPSGTVKLQWFSALVEQDVHEIYWLDSNDKGVADLSSIFLFNNPTGVILTHYEALNKWVKKDLFKKISFSLVVADECHRIKNRKAQRTIALKAIKADKKIGLSGTPYTTPSDIWSIYNWLDPKFFSSYWAFFNAHINYRERTLRSGQTIKEVLPQPLRDPANFARLMRQFTIQRTKEDVRADLPPKIETYVNLEMGALQRRYYSNLLNAVDPIVELAEGVETTVGIVLTQILRKIQVTTDPALLGLPVGASVKLDWVREWLADNPNESVLIATRFRGVAERLAAELEGFTLVVGGKRGAIDSSVRRIVGTISAMSEGLDLPHIDNTICIDVETSPILMQQLIDRTHRINIDVAKNIYYLQCVNTADKLVDMCWRNHWNTAELIKHYLNGKESEY